MNTSVSLHQPGLTSEQIKALRMEYGYNELPEKKESLFLLLLGQFFDPMVYILLGAAAVSIAVPFIKDNTVHVDELINAGVILAIVIINGLLGFFQEWRAENAIALLKKLSAPQVRVRRDGQDHVIASRELVPGDLMIIEAGDKLSADADIVLCSSLQVDESSLTGESVPVSKAVKNDSRDADISKLFAGTVITRGSAEAVVHSIGLQTEIGKITSMVMELKPPPTPLQIELNKVGSRIGILVIALCALIFFLGLMQGMEAVDVFFTAVSLAVAAVPEGLPAIVTVCLAIGVQRMISNNALIRRLDAIETLGNITVICADKTGTMTMNRMEVVDTWLAPNETDADLARIGAACNRAGLPDIGDPTEIALLVYAQKQGITRPEIDEETVPFTSEAKYMATRHTVDGRSVTYYKGAPEVIASMLNDEKLRAVIDTRNAEFAANGLRVLALAKDHGEGMQLVGLVAMLDPPRPEVKDAIHLAKRAGIRTIMITGDNPVTATSIAKKVGIETSATIDGVQLEALSIQELQHHLQTVSVFARVQPAHKVKILEALQQLGNVVAMSGDGVNDAPALKRSHVGVAMGKKGTDVARESAAMVLTDDNYATIVAAIAEGRRIYDNIQKFIIFLLRSNLGEVLIISSAMLFGMPLPLLPLHILWINLVTDSFPALALAAEKGESNIMQRPPRSATAGILTGQMPLLILAGALNAVLTLTVFRWSLEQFPGDLVIARSAALTTTIVYQLLLSLSTRSSGFALEPGLLRNVWLLGAIAFSMCLQLLLLFTPISSFFSVTALPTVLWGEIFGGGVVAFLLFELCKLLLRRTPIAIYSA